MKKSVFTVFTAIFALSLAACGNPAAEEQTDALQAEVSEAASEQTETETTTTTTAVTTTEITTTVTETEKVCTCKSEFQHACCEYLNNLDCRIGGGIYFGDINGDDMPEAVVGRNPYGFTYVLYSNENGLQILPLETLSVWGDVFYIADTKQILYSPMRGHTWGDYGYTEYHLYDWNGSDYEVTSSILRELGYYYEDEDGEHSGFGQAYIDGKEVDNDTFEVKLAEFEKLRDENNYFPIVKPDDENFESYMKENFPCFDNWDIIEYYPY